MLCMRIIIGPPSTAGTGFSRFANGLDEFIIVLIGGIDGSIAFIIFLIIDFFYLRKRIKNKEHQKLSKISLIITLPILIIAIHYILEYHLNWI